MELTETLSELLGHVERVFGFHEKEAIRLIEEINAYFSETVEEYVARRHRELQAEDLKNEAIFDRIDLELKTRRFAAPPLSARQIRRLIYG